MVAVDTGVASVGVPVEVEGSVTAAVPGGDWVVHECNVFAVPFDFSVVLNANKAAAIIGIEP